MPDILTDADKQRIVPNYDKAEKGSTWQAMTINAVRSKVESFAGLNGFYSEKRTAWVQRLTDVVSVGACRVTPPQYKTFNMETLTAAIETEIADATKDDLEEWRYDADAWRRWFPRRAADENGPTTHPWGDDTVAKVRWVLALSAYRVYRICKECRDTAIAIVDENMELLIEGDRMDSNIERAVKETFDREVAFLLQDYAAEQATKVGAQPLAA